MDWSVLVRVSQLSVDKRDYEMMRVQVVHNTVALNKSNASADSASSTTLLMCGKTSNSCNECRQVETSPIVAIGEMRCENQVLESKSDSVRNTWWCKT